MDASVSALVVAVVGVVGTLMSGLLAHRSALRAKSIEVAHAEQQRREEQLALERREVLETRRAAYTALNQSLRQFHAALFKQHQAYEGGTSDPHLSEQREEARHALRDVYAEAQMVVPDDVLVVAGRLVHRLFRMHALLSQYEQEEASHDTLRHISDHLQQTSENLYETRQIMRRDLGITELPIERPGDYVTD